MWEVIDDYAGIQVSRFQITGGYLYKTKVESKNYKNEDQIFINFVPFIESDLDILHHE